MLINVIFIHKKLTIKHKYHNCTEGIQIQTSVHRIIYSTSFGDVKEILYKNPDKESQTAAIASFHTILQNYDKNAVQLYTMIVHNKQSIYKDTNGHVTD